MKYLALALLLTGCAYTPPEPVRRDVRIVVKSPFPFDNPRQYGEASYFPAHNLCVIHLREYPTCLAHEVRHCYEDNWHAGRDTDEDC